MKYSIHITLLSALLLLGSCSHDDGDIPGSERELTLSADVREMNNPVDSKALGDVFSPEGGEIDVHLVTNNYNLVGHNFVYTYGDDMIFHGSPGFHFTEDNDYITTLTATWPRKVVQDEGFISDQRELADFKQADWMIATSMAVGIMPTNAPVPLTFQRQNSMIEFEMVGQNTAGLNIASLVLELQVNGVPTACWAYCGDVNGKAKLILPAGTVLSSPDNYLIGRISDGSGNEYSLIFPQTNLTMEAANVYLVTLTPQGYNMSIYAYIGGFSDATNGGIGIPFEQPQPGADGTFTITTFRQLVTMSYLVRHYSPDPQGFDWRSRTFILDQTLAVDPTEAAEYIPIPLSIFTGQIQQSGSSVTSITDTSGETVTLIDINS